MLLLNIGPKPDGTITDEETAVLKAMGKWLKVNGEGIYGATPWLKFMEGEAKTKEGAFSEGEVPYTENDFRFTCKNTVVYAFQMKPAEGTEVAIKSLRAGFRGNLVRKVTLLGSESEVKFTADKEALHITLSEKPETDLPLCFRIELL